MSSLASTVQTNFKTVISNLGVDNLTADNFTCNKLTVNNEGTIVGSSFEPSNGNVLLINDLEVPGFAQINQVLSGTIQNSSSTTTNTLAVSTLSTLSGTTNVNGFLNVTNDTDIVGSTFTQSTGDVSLPAKLTVTGTSTLNNNVSVTGTVAATGNMSANNFIAGVNNSVTTLGGVPMKLISKNSYTWASGDATVHEMFLNGVNDTGSGSNGVQYLINFKAKGAPTDAGNGFLIGLKDFGNLLEETYRTETGYNNGNLLDSSNTTGFGCILPQFGSNDCFVSGNVFLDLNMNPVGGSRWAAVNSSFMGARQDLGAVTRSCFASGCYTNNNVAFNVTSIFIVPSSTSHTGWSMELNLYAMG